MSADGPEQREADRLERDTFDENAAADRADERSPFADSIFEMAKSQMQAAQTMFEEGRKVGYREGHAKGYSEALDAALVIVEGGKRLAADLQADKEAQS